MSPKVGKQRRVTLPAGPLKDAGLEEGDPLRVQATPEGLLLRRWGNQTLRRTINRRAALRLMGEGVKYVGALCGIWAAGHHFIHDRESETERLRTVERELLRRLLGLDVADGSIALVPAANHPFKPTASFYRIESEAADAYRKRFFPAIPKIRVVRGYPEFKDDDSLVLFGSQVSNLEVRKHFGDPWTDTPRFTAISRYRDWTASLRWTLQTPADAPIHDIIQHGQPWASRDHRFVSAQGEILKSTYGTTQEDDFLLVTALPRNRRTSQRIVVFAGLHGAGTRATVTLFGEPPFSELEKLEAKTQGNPFYQALFHVSLEKDSSGDLRPRALRLVDATPLQVRFQRA